MVFFDGDRFRMSCIGAMNKGNPIFAWYEENRDGIHGVKPDLEQFAFAGSKKNNIIMWEGYRWAVPIQAMRRPNGIWPAPA